jgi:threonine/homoserine efflux transporter RhtA
MFSHFWGNNMSTELFSSNGCCTVTCLRSCYMAMGLCVKIWYIPVTHKSWHQSNSGLSFPCLSLSTINNTIMADVHTSEVGMTRVLFNVSFEVLCGDIILKLHIFRDFVWVIDCVLTLLNPRLLWSMFSVLPTLMLSLILLCTSPYDC